METAPRLVATSLFLEVFLYFGWWYDVFFWLVMIGIFVYKGTSFPYPGATFGPEFASILLFFVLDATRLSLGSAGNKAERAPQLFVMLALSCPLVAFFVYFMTFQVYVLRIEAILSVIGLVLLLSQCLLTVVPIYKMTRA